MRALITATCVAVVLSAGPSAAQTAAPGSRLVRGDVTGSIGFIQVKQREFQTYSNWHSDGYFALDGGWYWTNHLKTSIEVATTTRSNIYSSRPVDIGGYGTFIGSRIGFSSTRVSLSQHYQFGHNQWFHPYVGAGVDIVRERTEARDEPVFFYDQITRQSRMLREGGHERAGTEVKARPHANVGFKGYMSRSVFFLTDLRMTFDGRPGEVLTRIGVGVDF